MPTTCFKKLTCDGSRDNREAVQSPRAYLFSIVTDSASISVSRSMLAS